MLKIGLIGCSYMGGMHAACYKEIEDVKICAVADKNKETAEKIALEHGAEIFTSGEELIKKSGVDIVDICLPTFLHTGHAVLSMQSGKSVFIEKPLCLTRKECEMLIKTQEETGAIVQVGQVVRYWDEYAWLKKIYDGREYGEIHSAVFKRLSPIPAWSTKNWLHDATKSGSVVLDFHIHDVDFMRYLMGEPDEFATRAIRNKHGIMEEVFTTFTYGNTVVSVEGGWDYPSSFPFEMSYRVKFEEATAVFDGKEITVYKADGGIEKPQITPKFQGEKVGDGNISGLGGYFNELKSFTDHVKEGKEIEIASLKEAAASAMMMYDIIEAAGGMYK